MKKLYKLILYECPYKGVLQLSALCYEGKISTMTFNDIVYLNNTYQKLYFMERENDNF